MATHYISAWAGLLLPELVSTMPSVVQTTPFLLRFANCGDGNDIIQLRDARRILRGFPSVGARSLPFDHSSCYTRPIPRDKSAYLEQEVLRRHPLSGIHHPYSSMSEALRSWLESIQASVLVLHSGPVAILELYYPHRTARNFGYDQTVPPHR